MVRQQNKESAIETANKRANKRANNRANNRAIDGAALDLKTVRFTPRTEIDLPKPMWTMPGLRCHGKIVLTP